MAVIQDLPTEVLAHCLNYLQSEAHYRLDGPHRIAIADFVTASLVCRIWRQEAQRALWEDVWLYSKEDAERWMASQLQQNGLSTRSLTLVHTALDSARGVLKLCEGLKRLCLSNLGPWGSTGSPVEDFDLQILTLPSLAGLKALDLNITSYTPAFAPSPSMSPFPFRLSAFTFGQDAWGPHEQGEDFGCPAWLFDILVCDKSSRLTALDVSWVAPSQRLSSGELEAGIISAAPHLTALSAPTDFSPNFIYKVIRLAQSLTRLEVDADFFIREDFVDALSPTLCHLLLRYSGDEWEHVDAVVMFGRIDQPLVERITALTPCKTLQEARNAIKQVALIKSHILACEIRGIHIELLDLL